MGPTAIESVRFFKVGKALSRPLADSTHELAEISFIVTRIALASGITGEAYLLSFHYSPQAILGALSDVASMARGFDASDPAGFTRAYERESEYFGNPGVHRWALGSVNIAMWDARARTLGQSVAKLLGARRDRVLAYGSGGWLSYSLEELIDEVTGHVGRGFRAVKVKVGSPELERDVERLVRVREAVGPDVDVMIDANQGLDVVSASRLLEAVRHLRIAFFEEPLPHDDFAGYAELRRQARVPLAMGEREFDTVALRELIQRDGIDLWQPDILRLGGVEAWLASAAMAEASQIPVLPHFYKEYDVPLLVTIPNARGTECFDWVDDLVVPRLRVADGYAYANDGPGWGFRFKDDRLVEVTPR